MIELKTFQIQAAATIATRFADYWASPPIVTRDRKQKLIPFYQALASITGSGKTVIAASAVTQVESLLQIKPIVLWISKGSVVVAQTYANLQHGGKYNHLLDSFQISLLADYNKNDVADADLALVYFATVGTFNRAGRSDSDLKLFASDIDVASKSTWDSLKERLTDEGDRRPLLVVYDESQNLSDQQTELLLELEPAGLILATATPRLPQAIATVTQDLRTALGWSADELITKVPSNEVVVEGLVKKNVEMGGFEATMEATVDAMLEDMARAEAAAAASHLELKPKAIYVCKTNIVEGDANRRDDHHAPFSQRQAPPIRIWRYLVHEKGVDPDEICVYANLDMDNRAYPGPDTFHLFTGQRKDKDYYAFLGGGFRHIIFNLTLQEGWDDPECYFAYIDKSMGSPVQIEQVIGRVLRQPEARHFPEPILNTAHFYVKVDDRGVFERVAGEVRAKLGKELPDVKFATYRSKSKDKPKTHQPKKLAPVPQIIRDATAAHEQIELAVGDIIDFEDAKESAKGKGGHAAFVHKIGEDAQPELKWVERDNNNSVSARWIFQTAIRQRFPLALGVTPSDDRRFDARVQLRSPAEKHLKEAADRIVELYLEYTVLRQRSPNPYVVPEVTYDAATAEPFVNSLHPSYSGLGPNEAEFARALDKKRLTWCRNPSMVGYGIPLLSLGRSKTFYPDFLVWKGPDVFAIDPSGEHIVKEKVARKLLSIEPGKGSKGRVRVRLCSKGEYSGDGDQVSTTGYTVFGLGHGHSLKIVKAHSVQEVVDLCLKVDL